MKLTGRMHADEVYTDITLVKRLLTKQFPQWADLPIKRVVSSGTNNALYKLGDNMVVRLPRIPSAVKHIAKEYQWLPKITPHLPVSIPLPLALGAPGEGYPWPWIVFKWLEGVTPDVNHLAKPKLLAQDMAKFIMAIHKINPTDAPKARRGAPLQTQDPQARQAIKDLHGMIDTEAAIKVWETALQEPSWNQAPVWVHGDLMPGNMLLMDDRLSGVIDFEGMGIGDPACDLIVAWNLLPANVRSSFRFKVNVDDSTWKRGRGWAFSMALIQLPYYKDTNPGMAANARHVIKEVLADH